MTDTDVAHKVEAADLKQMTDMDIEDVYTLMDKEMFGTPHPIRLRRQRRQAAHS